MHKIEISDDIHIYKNFISKEECSKTLNSLLEYAESDAEFWKGISAINYFDRVSEPVLILHGTNDESCDIRWSETTTKALQDAGKTVGFIKYEGERHAFSTRWQDSMEETTRFFETYLKS
mgnify:CR=1 FL=1